MAQSYLKPKVGSPKMLRDKRNGQFVNPPLYMQLGGLNSSDKVGNHSGNMGLEKGGPNAKKGKPI